ncbi:MAG: hypothetical protein AVDCRST_MAG19-4536, partial [uncultured Thermomicrobiales bacterium]
CRTTEPCLAPGFTTGGVGGRGATGDSAESGRPRRRSGRATPGRTVMEAAEGNGAGPGRGGCRRSKARRDEQRSAP